METMETEVEDFLAHHGVKGMRWGVRNIRKQHELNKESRRKARIARAVEDAKPIRKAKNAHERAVDKARMDLASGKVKADYKNAKAKYKRDKKRIGRAEARRLLRKAKDRKLNTVAKANEIRDGREMVEAILEETNRQIREAQYQARQAERERDAAQRQNAVYRQSTTTRSNSFT